MCRKTGLGIVLVAISICLAHLTIADDATLPSVDPAKRLVLAALEAECKDDAALRATFLERALKKAPDYPPARWHSGFVREGEGWLKYDDVWHAAASDKRLELYRQMRSRADSADDHLTLARWCRKIKLDDRAQLHWMYVLAHDPANKEALRALGLRKYRGMLLTGDQIQAFEQHQKEAEETTAHWTARLEALRDAALGDDRVARDQALAEIRKIDEAEAIAAMMNVFAAEREDLASAAVDAMGNMQDPMATWALGRLALYSEYEQVREQAAKRLSKRPLHDFVPQMLSLLNTPVELRYHVMTFAGTSIVGYSLEQKGRDAHLVSTFVSGASSNLVVKRGQRLVPQAWATRHRFHENHVARALSSIRFDRVARHNQLTEQMNQRVYKTLTVATGQDLQDDPRSWWHWWADYNEVYVTNHVPLYTKFRQNYSQINIAATTSCSCFVAGTTVWTETGPQPIESIKIGDRVLSQDCETGELAYKMVMQTTVRPPSKTLRIEVDGDEIWSTLGHPFWTVGAGWQMAKQLEPGSVLHSVSGPTLIDSINPGPEASAHNLVVQDFSTYFVGQAKVLVHDNQPRRPTRVVVPGFADN